MAHSGLRAPGRIRPLLASIVAVLALALGSLVLAPVATATTPDATTSAAGAASTKWDPRLRPIAKKVASLRKLAFEHPVAAEFLRAAKFEKRVGIDRGKLSKTDKQDIERSQAQLRAVGLIGPKVDVVDSIGALQKSGVLAYYDPKTKKITVKGTNLDDVSTRVTVAHELTHALQDQHFNLQKLEKAAEADHGSTTLRTIIEGDAVRIQDAYEQSLSPADQQTYETENARNVSQAQSEISAQGVPDTLSVVFQAPYVLGQPMLDSVLAEQQTAGVNALFEHPPTADAAFVTPSTLLEHRTFQHVPTPKLQAGEKRSGKPDVFGSLSLFQVLASRVENATALSAADAWDGDAMVTFTRKRQTCLRATFAGRGTNGTTTITNGLRAWAARMPAGVATVDGTTHRVTLTACDPGSAATEIPNSPIASLVYLASRDGFFAELLKNGFPVTMATCSSDALVRDPAFAPVIEGAAADPSAKPDPSVIASVQQRVREIVAQCQET